MNETQLLKKTLEKKSVKIGNEVKIPDFAVYSDTHICGFFGPWRWMSNFWRCPNGVMYMDTKFPSVEHAYQAAKYPKESHTDFIHISSAEAKKLGQKAVLSKNWDHDKVGIMADLIYAKFSVDPNLKQKLLDTAPKYLEERNYWGDVFWGTNEKGDGKNILGKTLINVRDLLEYERV
jgi:ribA/ribD-fused uncharacterized protein